MRADLKSAQSHFRFGENWAAFARTIDVDKIDEARRDLGRFLDGNEPSGLTLDPSGRLFGVTTEGGANNAGTIFEIEP